jgi:hypothetical protein
MIKDAGHRAEEKEAHMGTARTGLPGYLTARHSGLASPRWPGGGCGAQAGYNLRPLLAAWKKDALPNSKLCIGIRPKTLRKVRPGIGFLTQARVSGLHLLPHLPSGW